MSILDNVFLLIENAMAIGLEKIAVAGKEVASNAIHSGQAGNIAAKVAKKGISHGLKRVGAVGAVGTTAHVGYDTVSKINAQKVDGTAGKDTPVESKKPGPGQIKQARTPNKPTQKSAWATDEKGKVKGTQLSPEGYKQHLVKKFGQARADAAETRARG